MSSVSWKEFTKSAQATGPENIGPERTRLAFLALKAVDSPSRITLESNGKFRPQPDRETPFARTNGGGNGTGFQPSLFFVLIFNVLKGVLLRH